MSHPDSTGRKRKQRETEGIANTFGDDVEDKKRKPNSANTSSSQTLRSLRQHLDFSALESASSIEKRANVVAEALLHDFRLVVRRHDAVEVEHEILELEFYLWKDGCHEDPFTHGSEEQKISGQWCVIFALSARKLSLIFMLQVFPSSPKTLYRFTPEPDELIGLQRWLTEGHGSDHRWLPTLEHFAVFPFA